MVEPMGRAAFGRAAPWVPVVVVTVTLMTWEVASRAGVISPLFFPAPTTIGRTIVDLTVGGELVSDLRITVWRLVQGLAFGGVAGTVVGLVVGWSPRARTAVDPLIALAHPVPKISLFPLFLVIFGLGDRSLILLVAFTTFFPMAINAMTGVQQISDVYFEVADNYGAGRLMRLRRVVLPGSLPFVIAGARLAINTGLAVTIAVELLSATEGLGATIWFAWETLRTEDLYAALVVIALVGILSNSGLRWLERRAVPWMPGRSVR